MAIYDDLLRFLTRRTGNSALAADLNHDVYERLARVEADIPTPAKARSYLFRMARNLAIDHQRVEQRRRVILEGSDVLFEDMSVSPEDISLSRSQLDALEKALAELPPMVAQVLLLSRVQGLKHRDVAACLGVSVSLVEKYQARALAHCRKYLETGA